MIVQWRDPESPWWAKMRRASQHIDEASRLLQAFEQSQSWRVEEGAGRFPNQQAFTLRITAQVPADTITVIGDAIHNMRSCLDAVAYSLAEQYLGRRLTESEMELPSFPICENEDKLEAFLRRRSALYGPIEIEAMRCVQPYALAEEAREAGVAATTDTFRRKPSVPTGEMLGHPLTDLSTWGLVIVAVVVVVTRAFGRVRVTVCFDR